MGRAYESIVPLLSLIGKNHTDSLGDFEFRCSEDDVMPTLDGMVKKRRTEDAMMLVEFLQGKGELPK